MEAVPVWLQVLGAGAAVFGTGAAMFAVLWRMLGERIDTKLASDQRWLRVCERLAAIEKQNEIMLKLYMDAQGEGGE